LNARLLLKKLCGGTWFRHALFWGPPLLYACLIFYMSAQSELRIAGRRLLVWDKMAHLFEFGLLALLLFRAWIHYPVRSAFAWRNVLWVAILVSLYGASDELHQLFVPNRCADIMDWVVDTLGAVLLLLPCLFLRTRPKTDL